MDEGSNRAVRTMFKRLYDDGLIYRAERMVNWSPALRSVLSDIEVEHKEVDGELVSIRYGDGDDAIVVATTRVETMLGDTAVVVHPDDERYRHLVGREIELPLVGRRIPILADDHVDPAFGTGAVKVTPAHDPNDFEIGRRHGLPMPSIMDESGRHHRDRHRVRRDGPVRGAGRRPGGAARAGPDRRREAPVPAQRRALARARRTSRSSRGCRCSGSSRSGRWRRPRATPCAMASVVVHPKELEPRWFAWVDNMYDWCISRQLWWGHRIPVWYGPAGEVVCLGPEEDPPAGWTQDEDVLDTWFSSGLWPFSTLGWPDDTVDLRRYYPTSVLVTGYDILFFWVARMMMFGLYAMDGEPPFHTIALHGMVRDEHGKKMSKSAGNTIDALAWLDRFGTDAVRFALARGANPGTDMPLGEDNAVAARNFVTKLWNATRFALANGASAELPLPADPTDADRWILGRLREVREQVDALLDDYQFAKATEALYHFTWGEFCDWYVELAKPQLRAETTADGTRAVLGHVLDALLKLLHPVSPFVTEALWTALTASESIVIAPWPVDAGAPVAPAAAAQVVDLQKLVTEVRRFRTEQGIPDSRRVAARVVGLGTASAEEALRSLARLDAPDDAFAPTATLEVALTGGPVHVELDTSAAIDVAAERARLGRDLAAAQKELDTAEKKLGNPKFVEKAPAPVVDGIRARREAAHADIARVSARLAALPS